jgi:hypothetical protein
MPTTRWPHLPEPFPGYARRLLVATPGHRANFTFLELTWHQKLVKFMWFFGNALIILLEVCSNTLVALAGLGTDLCE